MRNIGIVLLIVISILVGVVYVGGTVDVGGKKPFEYLDQACGTNFFMGCYYSLRSLLARHESNEEDEWTKVHQDWKKVLKNTVE